MKNIVFFGGGKLLVSLLMKLRDKKQYKLTIFASDRHLKEVIGGKITLKSFLKKNNFNYIAREKLNINEIKKEINEKFTLAISIGAPWIFKNDIIDIFKKNFFNIHGSNLPEDKGGGGFTWQILQGNKLGYANIHYLTNKIDEGKIVMQTTFKIDKLITPIEVNNVYIKHVINLFMKFIKKYNKKKIKGRDQNISRSTYWPRINTEIHGWINWDWSGIEISRFIKGFDDPYNGAHSIVNKKKVYLKKCVSFKKRNFHSFQAGIVFRKNKKNYWISTKGGYIIVKEILNSNKKILKKSDIKIGDRFYTPSKFLEKAKTKRVYYHLR